MSSDGTDWSFPPVEPAEPREPVAEVPAEAEAAADPVADAAVRLGFGGPQVPAWDDVPTAAYALPAEDPPPPPVPAALEPVWAYDTPLPPAPNLDIPRRNPATGTPVSPLRALAGALVAVAGVLLGIGALLWATESPGGDPTVRTNAAQGVRISTPPSPVASVAPSRAASVAPSPRPIAAQSSPAAVLRPEPVGPPKLPLTVLNNSNRNLLADRAAREFRTAGWPIRLTGNFTGRVSETTVYYEPGQLAAARLLQRSFPELTRVRPRFETLPGEGLTVVLTRSYNA